jgi:hypothetical protein
LVVVDGVVEKALDRVNCVVLAQEEFIGEVDVEAEVKASEADVILSVLDVIVVE